ncbi:MAG: hypothetical protein QM786_09115 [Breznakibacter sp.]
MKPINQTPNGCLTLCKNHNHYHLEFGNIFMNLSPCQLDGFTKYVMEIDIDQYMELNKHACNKRKLMLQIGHCGAFFCLTPNELFELRELLSVKSQEGILPNGVLIPSDLILN